MLAELLAPSGVLLLTGELAAGKTVLTRGLAGALGIPAHDVQSPSYTLIHQHQGAQGALIHIDLYRLSPEEALGLGLEELLEQPAVKVVEWPDRLPFDLPDAYRAEISILPSGERQIVWWPPIDAADPAE